MQCFLRENDCLTVGSIQICVLKVSHDSVKLGITDPKASPTYREELLYIKSDDDDDGDIDETEFERDPVEIENFSPWAASVVS